MFLFSRTELSSVLSPDIIATIISDPTQITSSKLGLTKSQQSAAILAYSK